MLLASYDPEGPASPAGEDFERLVPFIAASAMWLPGFVLAPKGPRPGGSAGRAG